MLQDKDKNSNVVTTTTVSRGNTGDSASMGAITALGGSSTLESHSQVNQLAALQSSALDPKTDDADAPLRLPSQHHPMRVIGSIDGDGLGLLSWWE